MAGKNLKYVSLSLLETVGKRCYNEEWNFLHTNAPTVTLPNLSHFRSGPENLTLKNKKVASI